MHFGAAEKEVVLKCDTAFRRNSTLIRLLGTHVYATVKSERKIKNQALSYFCVSLRIQEA